MTKLPTIKHFAAKALNRQCFSPSFLKALEKLGNFEVIEHCESLDRLHFLKLAQSCDIILGGHGTFQLPAELHETPGHFKYFCHATGELRKYISLDFIKKGILVSNWGDSPAFGVAEGAMTLLLAMLKDLPYKLAEVKKGKAPALPRQFPATLYKSKVGIYGFGVIGKKFLEMLQPFGAVISIFDPYLTETPTGTQKVSSLQELFSNNEIIVIHAPQTPETIGSITAELLRQLPEGGILINTARPLILDQAAAFKEVTSGRLRMALDVVNDDQLESGEPLRQNDQFIWTGHKVATQATQDGRGSERLHLFHEVALENINNFTEGKPLRFLMDETRYLRST